MKSHLDSLWFWGMMTLAGVTAIWLFTSAVENPGRSHKQIFQNNLVYLSTEESSGSGVMIDPRTIVTAYHVACDSRIKRVYNYDFSKNWEADAIICRPELDVAIVRTHWPNTSAYHLKVSNPSFYDAFHFMGFGVNKLSYRTGRYSTLGTGVETPGNPPPVVRQTGMAANPGDSGGPLLNDRGELTGILHSITFRQVFAGWKVYSIPVTNTAVAIPGDSINSALDDYREVFRVRQ